MTHLQPPDAGASSRHVRRYSRLDRSSLAEVLPRLLGLLAGQLALAGGDLPINLRLVAQQLRALALLPLPDTLTAGLLVLTRSPRALVGGRLALIGPQLALVSQTLPLIGQRLALIPDPLALLGDQLPLRRDPLTLLSLPNHVAPQAHSARTPPGPDRLLAGCHRSAFQTPIVVAVRKRNPTSRHHAPDRRRRGADLPLGKSTRLQPRGRSRPDRARASTVHPWSPGRRAMWVPMALVAR